MKKKAKEDRLLIFERLSAILTGFSVADIRGTGLSTTYLETISSNLNEQNLGELFAAFERLDANKETPLTELELNSICELVEHDKYGPLVKNIILLWYTGQWPGLGNDSYIISSQAYIEGLVWRAVGSHPMGAKQEGFGTWAFPPNTFSS